MLVCRRCGRAGGEGCPWESTGGIGAKGGKGGAADLDMVDCVDEVLDRVEIGRGFRHVEAKRVCARPTSQPVRAKPAAERIVAIAAGQAVIAAQAREAVVAAVAKNGIGERIARAVDCGGAEERQFFDVVGKDMADRRGNAVITFAGRLDDLIAGVIDDIAVIADAPDQDIGTGAAIELVVAAVTLERIVARAARELVVAY